MELNLGFLASGNGSNVHAIVNNIYTGDLEARARVVVCNKPRAGVFDVANRFCVPDFYVDSKRVVDGKNADDIIFFILKNFEVNLVLLCGYNRIVGERIVEMFKNRILNIHPALLPKYGGRGMYGYRVHDAVIASSDRESGATVHLVDNEYDHGRILAQVKVPRYEKDSSSSLGERVLRFEHVLYTQVLRDIQKGLIDLNE